ncbi:MAG TPA: DUF3445 domain-containing protein [Pseudolysinimonas sp.]|nr:DUF3445 domain-containing protein [Pseudolysinimonas sp.]
MSLSRFPFPFRGESYRYSTNIEPALSPVPTDVGSWGERIIELDEHYDAELAERAEILVADPTRCATAPHMRPAEWDALLFCLTRLAEEYPDSMKLQRDGNRFTWQNKLQGIEIDGIYGDDSSVPEGPLRFLSTQIQDDIALLDQREGSLWLDAGVVTFGADWSMGFDTGMKFLDIHGPVPRVHEEAIITRAHEFLLRLEPGQSYRRTNWTMTVGRRLDTSTETYPDWGQDRTAILSDPEFPDALHLRVEVQHLIKLPHTGALMFLIRSYLEPIAEIATVPAWRNMLGHVLRELPDDMADYKGITKYRHLAADWLLDSEPVRTAS